MTLRIIPRPRDRAWRYSWLVTHCTACYAPRLVPLELVDVYGPPSCNTFECPERSDA